MNTEHGMYRPEILMLIRGYYNRQAGLGSTMVIFLSKANVVFTPRAEDVSCEENISRNAAQFFGLIANSKYRQVQNLS